MPTSPPIPFVDLRAQFESIRPELTDALLRSFESQRYIQGPEVDAFEREFSEWHGIRATVSCASGTDALLLALMALNVGPGDEVITTPFTFVATIGSIVRLGARPVFVDIDRSTMNLATDRIESAITPRTRAVMPVHLFGCPADMAPLASFEIPVIEDAAQAIGARYRGALVGTVGQMGCFSFFPSKNLGAAGDGGAITVSDPELEDRLRVIASHGSRTRYTYERIGFNSRLDAMQAAVLRIKLQHLAAWTERRRRHAQRYRELFSQASVQLPVEPEYAHHCYNLFTIRHPNRDALKQFLHERGIPSEIYYPSPLHLQPAYEYLGYRDGSFPEAERAAAEVLSLPIYPELTDAQIERIVSAVTDFDRR